MRSKTRQLQIQYPNTWGGRRKGAGRPRTTYKGRKSRVAHTARPKLASRFPVHVTLTALAGLPQLRGFAIAKILRAAFVRACGANRERGAIRSEVRGTRAQPRKTHGEVPPFRICQFSIQGNHIHLICEAKNQQTLSRGVQGFKIRVTRALNKHWGGRTSTGAAAQALSGPTASIKKS